MLLWRIVSFLIIFFYFVTHRIKTINAAFHSQYVFLSGEVLWSRVKHSLSKNEFLCSQNMDLLIDWSEEGTKWCLVTVSYRYFWYQSKSLDLEFLTLLCFESCSILKKIPKELFFYKHGIFPKGNSVTFQCWSVNKVFICPYIPSSEFRSLRNVILK